MRVLKWIGGIVGGLLLLAILVIGVQMFRFSRARAAVHDVPTPPIVASTDSAVIARGEHLAHAYGGCVGCHGEGLRGGLVEDVGPLGVISAPNLTRGKGGVADRYTDAQLARTIRYGIRPDGRTLLWMPTEEHNWWPDEELQAVVSFVRSVPPVDHEVAPASVRPLGQVLTSFGVVPTLSYLMIDASAPRETVPAPAPTAEYGAFLVRGCKGCHGDHLSGGRIPGAPATLPMPLNLTMHPSGLGGWTEEQFVSVLNTGVRPDGRKLADFMPIATTRAMNDTEKRATWAYLRSIEPRPEGGR
jgi:mono/diheme cytochrome c family protein